MSKGKQKINAGDQAVGTIDICARVKLPGARIDMEKTKMGKELWPQLEKACNSAPDGILQILRKDMTAQADGSTMAIQDIIDRQLGRSRQR
jgi:hypothetical protein